MVAIGRDDDHLQVALELGMTRAINSSDRSALDQFAEAAEVLELLASGKLRSRGVLENVRS
jgi:hypothetical protein